MFGFPMPADEQHPPPLTSETFTECYNALFQFIDYETWIHPEVRTPYGADDKKYHDMLVQGAYKGLNEWRDHALDGDLAALPNAPWDELHRLQILTRQDRAHLDTEIGKVHEFWQSPAGDKVETDLQDIKDNLDGYATTSPGQADIGNGCFIAQVGTLLKAAFATQAAYKKDLYQIAKTAHDLLHAIDSGGQSHFDVGSLILAVAGTALIGAGQAIAGSEMVGAVFGAAAVGQVGNLVFAESHVKITLSGQTPIDIMDSVSSAVQKATEHYRQACQKVSSRMYTLWKALDDEYRLVPSVPQVQSVDTSARPSYALSNFLPTDR